MNDNNTTETETKSNEGVSLEQYQKCAELLDEIKEARLELWEELEGDFRDDLYKSAIMQLARYEKNLRADLQKEMMDSHPGKWRADLFMGDGL